MTALADKECVPCKGGVPPLKGEELKKFSAQLGGDWKGAQFDSTPIIGA